MPLNPGELLTLYRIILGATRSKGRSLYETSSNGSLGMLNPMERMEAVEDHAGWMISHMPDPEADPLKFQRWLGFVQAALWFTGTYSLDQLRTHVRLAFGAEARPEREGS